MTKTEATRRARAALSHGYFRRSTTEMDVRYNGRMIRLYGTCGRLPSRPDQIAQLVQAIQDLDEYGESSAEVRP